MTDKITTYDKIKWAKKIFSDPMGAAVLESMIDILIRPSNDFETAGYMNMYSDNANRNAYNCGRLGLLAEFKSYTNYPDDYIESFKETTEIIK